MNILIIGKTGTGKSNLGDIIKSYIFKYDKNAKIQIADPSRSIQNFGSGTNQHLVEIHQAYYDSTENYDIVININNKNFIKFFEEINE